MSFFRRLFGGDGGKEQANVDAAPAGAAVAATTETRGAPYRGALYVEQPTKPAASPRQKRKKPPAPIWDSNSYVLAIERDAEDAVQAVVYCGEREDPRANAVRRVSFAEHGPVLDWELPLASFAYSARLACRVRDRVIAPRQTGVIAVHLTTGEPCWELPHPATLHARPRRYPEADVLLVFSDQSWMRIDPRDGTVRGEGAVRSERELSDLVDALPELDPRLEDDVTYGGCEVRLGHHSIVVRAASNRDADLQRRVPRATDDPPGPSIGHYPVEEWEPCQPVALVRGRLVVGFTRRWGSRAAAAVGILEPTSLEPLRLLELGDADQHAFGDGRVVDDLFMVAVRMRHAYRTFVIDPHAERVIGCFVEHGASLLFDADGRAIWSHPL